MAQGSDLDFRLVPPCIASTQSLLNPMNNYLKSFGHTISFALHPIDWSSRRVVFATHSRFIEHGLAKIKFPVLPNEIPGLEDKLHYRINLLTFDDPFEYMRYAQYISKRYYPEKINLLFRDKRYAWIKHFSRLFADSTK